MAPSLFHESNETRLFGFLIVITPSPEIETYVHTLKSEFYYRFGTYESMHSIPHITICHFPMLEERQDKVFSLLRKGLSEINPSYLNLNGFGHFINSNVIYLRVEQSEELRSLEKFFIHSKRQIRLGKRCIVVAKHHLTIAKGLKPDIFKSACDDYLSGSYHNSFWVDRLSVLRYDPYEGRYSKLMDLKLGKQSFPLFFKN